MPKTVRNLVDRALQRIRVVNPRETTPAEYSTDALAAYNEMLHAWKAQDVDVFHDDQALTDNFELGDEHFQAVAALLAVRLCDNYGIDPSGMPTLVRDARNGWNAIQAEFMPAPETAGVEAGLRETTHMRGFWATNE